MSTFTIGAAKVTRIEETYEPNFDAKGILPDWQPDVVERHRDWMLPNHYDPASGKLKFGVHSWLVQVGRRLQHPHRYVASATTRSVRSLCTTS